MDEDHMVKNPIEQEQTQSWLAFKMGKNVTFITFFSSPTVERGQDDQNWYEHLKLIKKETYYNAQF